MTRTLTLAPSSTETVGRGPLPTSGRALLLLTLMMSGPGARPGASQEPTDTIPPDSVFQLAELSVPIGRLRLGAAPIASAPFPVQTLRGGPRDTRGLAASVGSLPGVSLGNQTGSPSQSDLRVRGFAVSPVVGLPQSVSVFVDGVRVNEADASQVHLSLIPSAAIERVELVRGPVGAFGKNTLAGTLNIVTRRGSEDTYLETEAEGGSFGSAAGTVRAGGRSGQYDGLLAASYRREDGWRALERSVERSVFGKIGWRGDRTDAWISYTFESDSLEGPGPLPESWIDGGALPADIVGPPDDTRRLQYTGGNGDAFRARMHFLNARLDRELADDWSLQSTTFVRRVDFQQSNDNITEPDALGLTDISSMGSTAQITHRPHEDLLLIAGGEAVRNRVDIDIREIPNAAFPNIVPGTTELLRTDEDNLSAFGEAWWTPRATIGVHLAWRFDRTFLPVTDLLDPADSGENTFRQWSGGLGLSAELAPGVRAFAGYGRGFRAPVILEVSCADPEDPCQLPFELGPDPPLKPVTSDSWQAGVRTGHARLQAEVVGYWSEVHDDIFNIVALETPTRGFFTNLDRTRRVGGEVLVEATPVPALPGLSVLGALGWTRATFQSSATLSAPFVDDDDEDEPEDPQAPPEQELTPPEVEPGDRFPMIPTLTTSLRISYAAGPTRASLDTRWTGAQHLVGDEANDAPFDRLGGYTLVDVALEHRVGRVTAYLEITNALDREYAPFGIISRNVRGAADRVERFLTPGRPRALRVGVRARTGG